MTAVSETGLSNQTILSLKHIEKSFGGIHALADVSFDLQAGEIHALVGENGAGKSTLIKIITGAYTPDAGVIEINGRAYGSLQPSQARDLGIAAVYQEFNILPELSVAENISLGEQPLGRYHLIDTKVRVGRAYELLERLGAHTHIDPNELVKYLTVGEQQLVEIAKALAINARILIMDEPSAVLPSRDLDRLFTVIRNLCDEGRGIIYISHRLNEIFELADRVTVLKDGQTMATKEVADTHNAELVSLMVGRPWTDMYPPKDNTPGEILLEVHDLYVEGTVFNVNFNVRAGEVVGMAGLGGSGRTTVCRALVGLGDIRSGQVLYQGKPAARMPAAAARAGMVLVPEDRKSFGLVLNQTMRFNLALPNLSQFLHMGVLSGHTEKEAIQKTINDVQIKPPTPEISTENLSGGNQQKVVVGKWLLANPRLVIFDEPTRGIDVGAKAEIYLRIRELTRQGVGVIMASSELPELIGMSDRILVFHEGHIVGELSRPEFSEEAIMHLATASHLAQAQKVVDTSRYKKEGPYVIAVLHQDVSNGWGLTYNLTIQAYGKELLNQGVLAKTLLYSTTNDAEKQISDLAEFIEQKPDAIVIEPLDRIGTRPIIKRALEVGIPVVLCANGIEGEDFTSRVDIDFYESAYRSGEGLAGLLGGRGNVVLFNGIASADSTITWRKAALDALSKSPAIQVIAEEYTQWNVVTSKQRMEALISAHPQIDGVWAGGGEMALGAALAFIETNRPAPKFAMVNVPNGFLRLAKQYKYQFVVAPDPPAMSRYGLQTAIEVLQGKPIKKFINVKTLMDGADLFDHTSIEKWYVPELNDDFVPPATVGLKYYLEGGFHRVLGE
jgi:ABC-type sugar transport system ATPase subunit/ABC-type sugar transport system substrate-binding protein